MNNTNPPSEVKCCEKCAGMRGLSEKSGVHVGQCWNFKCECHTNKKCCERGNEEVKHEMSETICEMIVQTDWPNESAKGVDRLSKLADEGI